MEKLKDATPPVPRADQPTVAVPVATAVPFPSKSPTPPTIPIVAAVNNTPAITNNLTIGNHATIDNMNISKEYDKGEIGDVDDFDALVMDFYNVNENSIAKNDTFSPSTKKSKITVTDDTSQKEKNYTREEDIALCKSFINLSKNSVKCNKLEVFWGNVHKLFGELIIKGTMPRDSISKIWSH